MKPMDVLREPFDPPKYEIIFLSLSAHPTSTLGYESVTNTTLLAIDVTRIALEGSSSNLLLPP
jgi:hypothetical protein